jgi:hypothetical protein
MRLDGTTSYACDLCLQSKEAAELERVRSDVLDWRDKRPTVHADICTECQQNRPISELTRLLRVKISLKEQEKTASKKGTDDN